MANTDISGFYVHVAPYMDTRYSYTYLSRNDAKAGNGVPLILFRHRQRRADTMMILAPIIFLLYLFDATWG